MSKFYRKSVIIEEASKTGDGFPLAEGSHPIREHEACKECLGDRWIDTYAERRLPCPHCLKDAEGKPTGAEPGTAGEWRVKP